MMEQIRMVEVDEMVNYKNYNLVVDKSRQLDINDSDEVPVSSENSDGSDKGEDEQ